ncbi:MAG: 4'-phosphopantetheinyl transferase superfamily protein [Pseudomonadota bacterium]
MTSLTSLATPVRLMVVSLDGEPARFERGNAWLSNEEQQRANRFKFEHHRVLWTRSRIALRSALAAELDAAPESLVFDTADNGKPHLRAHPSLKFNLSHSHEKALIAIGDRDVGCDIEYVKPIRDWAAVTRRFFSAHEQHELAKLPERDKLAAFYRVWTRKEAVIKATGQGLRADLRSFDVSIMADAAVLNERHAPIDALPWQLGSMSLNDEYVGAVALRAIHRVSLNVCEWAMGRHGE